MALSWHALHAQLLHCTTRLAFRKDFEVMRRRHRCLGPFRDAAGLLDQLHGPGGDPAARNEVLVALVGEAQSVGPAADTAFTLMLLALWPGLDAVRGRVRRRYDDKDELAGDLVGRLTLGIRSLDLGRVNRIAATLLMNLERDLKRDLARRRREGPGAKAAEDIVDTGGTRPLFARPDGDHDGARRELAGDLRALIGEDTQLVMAVAVDGISQRDAAKQLGISHEAARKRYQRARLRLRQALEP